MYAKSDDNLIIRENGVTTVHINGLHGFALTNSAAKSPAAPDSVITHFLAQHIANAASILPAEYFIEKLVNCRNQENVRFRFRVGVNVFEITREANAEPITLSAPPHQDFSNGVVAATVVGDQEGGFVFPPHTYDVHRFDKFDRQNKPVNPSFVAKLLSHSSGHNFFIVDDRFPTEDRVGFAHAGGRIEKDIERSKKEGTPERVRLIVLTFKPPLANG